MSNAADYICHTKEDRQVGCFLSADPELGSSRQDILSSLPDCKENRHHVCLWHLLCANHQERIGQQYSSVLAPAGSLWPHENSSLCGLCTPSGRLGFLHISIQLIVRLSHPTNSRYVCILQFAVFYEQACFLRSIYAFHNICCQSHVWSTADISAAFAFRDLDHCFWDWSHFCRQSCTRSCIIVSDV